MFTMIGFLNPGKIMSKILVFCAVLVALPCMPLQGVAQQSDAKAEMRRGLRAAAQGDTATALARLNQAIAMAPELAEAYFYRGTIYARRALGDGAFDFQDRKRARESLEAALTHDPENPKYLLALGKLMQQQDIMLDSRRMFERALESAASADAGTLADVHFQLGIMHETQWRRFRYRHRLPPYVTNLVTGRALDDPHYVWRMLDRSAYYGSRQGESDRLAMLDHFHAALEANPAHEGAAIHLLAYLYDEGQIDQYLTLAREFVRAVPSSARAYLALGLGLHRAAQPEEAAGAFRYALSLMNEDERELFRMIGRIMKEDQAKRVDSLPASTKTEFRRRFWAQSDPLFLSAVNEFWLGYMARMTYVDIRFSVPSDAIRGWQTDRGIIYLRYGEPDRKATFSPSMSGGSGMPAGQVVTVWSYGYEGPVFFFRQNPGYRKAIFVGNFHFYAENMRHIQPVQIHPPTIPKRLPVPVQLVRYRGSDGIMDVAIHAQLPLDSLTAAAPVAEGEVEMGLFVLDGAAREVKRLTSTETLDFKSPEAASRVESWRVRIPADGAYLIGVEAREPLTWRAAIGRKTLQPKRFPAGRLSVSDILLADRVQPRVEEPTERSDFDIHPNPAMVYESEEPIALYFEIYNLLPDEEGFVDYGLEIIVTVEEIQREGFVLGQIIGELADEWGLTDEGAEAAQLRFEQTERVIARDVVPEYFKVQLTDAPAGRYSVKLIVRDRNATRRVVVERSFQILEKGDTP